MLNVQMFLNDVVVENDIAETIQACHCISS